MVINYLNGFLAVIVFLILLRIFLGLRLKLYFINEDSSLTDQSIIPVVYYNKSKSLLKGNWKEDIELVLTDERGNPFTFNIKFGLFSHYFVQNNTELENVAFNNKVMTKGKRYYLTNWSKIKVGDRVFKAKSNSQRTLIKSSIYA
jgi:hypothetical protein